MADELTCRDGDKTHNFEACAKMEVVGKECRSLGFADACANLMWNRALALQVKLLFLSLLLTVHFILHQSFAIHLMVPRFDGLRL